MAALLYIVAITAVLALFTSAFLLSLVALTGILFPLGVFWSI
ncbi:hypothetical protein [Acutalibacter intestini]|nr:hypothetical protein [Acutalibacter sp. M00204]